MTDRCLDLYIKLYNPAIFPANTARAVVKMIVSVPAKMKSPRKLGINTLDSTSVLLGYAGGYGKPHSGISLQTILSKFKETSLPLFLIHIYPAKLTGAATRSTRSISNIFFMVVLYVGGRVVVEVDVIQHKRVTCVEEGEAFRPLTLLTAVSTHEEHHFPVYYEVVN